MLTEEYTALVCSLSRPIISWEALNGTLFQSCYPQTLFWRMCPSFTDFESSLMKSKSALCRNLRQSGFSQRLSHATLPLELHSTYGHWGFWKNICQSNLYFSLAAVARIVKQNYCSWQFVGRWKTDRRYWFYRRIKYILMSNFIHNLYLDLILKLWVSHICSPQLPCAPCGSCCSVRLYLFSPLRKIKNIGVKHSATHPQL